RYAITATAHVVGSAAAGLAFGAALGAIGQGLADALGRVPAALVLAVAAATAAAVDQRRRGAALPGPRRQVDEDWLHRYRGWVYGLAVDLPPGWAGRVTRRPVDPAPPAVRTFAAASGRDLTESTHAVAHLANFPLPENRGDFGSGAVEVMGPRDVLVVLLEYHP